MPDVIVYSKEICPYCDRAKQLLKAKGVEYSEKRIDQDPALLAEMLSISEGRRTVPQIFINGQGVGGFDDLWALERAGKLDQLLNS